MSVIDHHRVWCPHVRDIIFKEVLDSQTPPDYDLDTYPAWGDHRVYFLHVPDLKIVKIGHSRNLKQRLAAIWLKGSGFEGKLVGCLNGGQTLETEMHRRFKPERIHGEWYREAILAEARTLIDKDREFYGTDPLVV